MEIRVQHQLRSNVIKNALKDYVSGPPTSKYELMNCQKKKCGWQDVYKKVCWRWIHT